MTGKRWLAYLLVAAILLVVGAVALIVGSTLLGTGPVVAAVHRDPSRCYFASESVWDVCKAWLPEATTAPNTSDPPAKPRYIKGLYISHYALGSDAFVNRIKSLLEETELNAVVMDVKGDRGYVVYASSVPLAQEIGANDQVMIDDFPAFMQWFKDHNVYTIARIVTFKDNLLSAAHPEWAVRDSTTGGVWKDGEGLGWGDPTHREVQDYDLALAVEAAKQGFDEIEFDYVRFPSDGAVGHAVFSGPNTFDNRVSTIAGFLGRAKAELAPYHVKVGADTFGYTAWLSQDMGIGQLIEALAPNVDVLSPMLYPSTFSDGLPNDGGTYRNAIAFPYDIVHKSTRQAVARTKGINPQIEIRPWIQDFPDYAFDERTYTPAEIRAQMDGARDAGGGGWLLWDPAVKYTRDALGSAQPSYPPNLRGYTPILRYGEIGRPEQPGQRTPEQLRADLQRLLDAGYYPVSVRQMVEGKLSVVPEGKRPVVLTFDGSTPGQFRMQPGGSVDPDSAVGILKAFHDAHIADWPLAATFFIAPGTTESSATVFGQPAFAQQKLTALIQWGLELGTYGMDGQRLGGMSADDVQRELGLSQSALERWLPGARIYSLALPGNALPNDTALLVKGEYDGMNYAYGAVVGAGVGLAPAPTAPNFDPRRLPRIEATDAELDRWLDIANRPGVSYVSAGE